jgi:hypothetical protein
MVSGLWHGAGIKFLIWGLLHAVYQIIGDITFNLRECIYTRLKVNLYIKMIIKYIGTFLLVNWAWIIFRANNVLNGIDILKYMFVFKKVINSYFADSEIFTNGFAKKEIIVLFFSICVLVYVEIAHYRKLSISNKIMSMKLPVRWTVYMLAILTIMIFGTYGYGFNAQDFIYGGF